VKTVRLGRTGLKVSNVCLGTMTFGNQCDEATSFAIMDKAFDAGVFFFDTADVYPLGATPGMRGRTESIVGAWLGERKRRDQVVVATKCRGAMGDGANDGGLSRKHVMAAIDQSLVRLDTDYVDLYQVHFPDDETPIEETLDALDDVVRAGKARYVGASNFMAHKLGRALAASERLGLVRFESDQPRYNILYREIENEIVPLCHAEGLGLVTYNPLAGGMLTGRYTKGQSVEAGTRFSLHWAGKLYQQRYWQEAVFEAVEKIRSLCAEGGRSMTQASIAWVLAQPGITSAIVGASRPQQLDESLPGASLELSAEEMAALGDIWFDLPRLRDPAVALR
jgi:1-deoxyxylulose-5-phosphate synthase